MKKILFTLSIFFALNAYAQHNPKTLIAEDELPTMVERIIERRDSVMNDGYKIRKIKSHINLEFASSANAYFSAGQFDEMSFKMNRVRLEIYGRLNDHLSYHFRQSFSSYNNVNTVENLPSSIEYANLKWRFNDKFDLVVGKQFLAVAGYEGYVNGLLVREFSEFNNNFEIFQTGLKGSVYLTPDQHLYFQVVNHRTGTDNDMYIHGLPEGLEPTKFPLLATANWTGWFADGAINLQYSASVGQLAKGKNIYYLMCGNIYEKGPVLAYLDVLYQRSGLDTQHRITTLSNAPVTAQNTQYFTVIANVDYRFHPKWNAFVKGTYDWIGMLEGGNGYSKGLYRTALNYLAGVEFYPMHDSDLHFFCVFTGQTNLYADKALMFNKSNYSTQNASIGFIYKLPVF